MSSGTSTPLPTTTPIANRDVTKTSSPSSSPVRPNLANTPTGDLLLLKILQENSFLAMNHQTGRVEKVPIFPQPPWCPYAPLKDLSLVCFTEDHEWFIYDPVTGTKDDLGIQTPFGIVKGQNFYYGVPLNDSEYAIYELDLETREPTLKWPRVATEDWNGYLEPVMNGDSFVVQKGDNRLYQVESSGETRLISPDLYNSWNYTVSPIDSSLLAFGAAHSDERDGGVPYPDDAYITNLQTGETKHIDLKIQSQGKLQNYGWPSWSPDGQKLAIFLDYWICIYDVYLENHNCIEMPDNNRRNVRTVAWSPNGEFLAFNLDYHRIAILDLETVEVKTLTFDEAIEEIYWR